jgi:hypothetical protein
MNLLTLFPQAPPTHYILIRLEVIIRILVYKPRIIFTATHKRIITAAKK